MPRRRRNSQNPIGDIVLSSLSSALKEGGPRALWGIVGVAVVLIAATRLDDATFGLAVTGCFVIVVAVCWINHTARARAKRELIVRQRGLASIAELKWQEFEELVGELYRQRGFRVTPRSAGGADGGIDIVIERNGATTLVQCKHWKCTTVGAPIVREMMGIIVHQGAAGGKIVCSGKFTRQAIEFAKGKPIELVSGEALWSMVEETKHSIGGNSLEA